MMSRTIANFRLILNCWQQNINELGKGATAPQDAAVATGGIAALSNLAMDKILFRG